MTALREENYLAAHDIVSGEKLQDASIFWNSLSLALKGKAGTSPLYVVSLGNVTEWERVGMGLLCGGLWSLPSCLANSQPPSVPSW